MLISAWSIELFGGLKAQRQERELRRFQTRKAGSLLAYLAYNADRPHPRELLVDRFWPEMEPQAARHNLRQTLFSLRRLLEPADVQAGSVLVTDRDRVCLQAGSVQTDVALFQRTLRHAEQSADAAEQQRLLEQAIALYRGELLSGFYDEWIFPERTRLAEGVVSAMSRVAALHGTARRFDQAIDHLRAAHLILPFEEAIHRQLIALYLAAGRNEEAREQYQTFARMLREEFGTAPSFPFEGSLDGGKGRALSPPASSASLPRSQRKRRTQVVSPALESVAPDPVRSALFRPNLPAPLTRFFGREEEIDRICTLLSRPDMRLLTLTGPGGSGKTRLALEAARRRGENAGPAVHFVPLADLSSPTFLPDAIVRALDLQFGSDLDIPGQLVTYFQSHPTLLLLDNFEHLVEEGAEIVQSLLERVPALRCLVTSRRRLNLPGEREMTLSPLPVPPIHTPADENGKQTGSLDLLSFPSVAMFVDRAQAARPDFGATECNISVISALCSRLEGMPLAIELAAARMGALTAGQMLSQLENSLDLLVDRRRGVPERHRSLRAALDWSYSLLAPQLQAAFEQLSIFRGGWTLESAGAVLTGQDAGSGSPTPEKVLEWLEILRLNSLIVTEERGEILRFRMLETLREYGRERMTEHKSTALSHRFADYFLRLAEEAGAGMRGPEQALWYERLEDEHDNLRSAMNLSGEQEAWEQGLRIATGMGRFWEVRDHFVEGSRFFEGFLAHAEDLPISLIVSALHRCARLLRQIGDMTKARQMCEESVRPCRESDDLWTLGEVLVTLSSYLVLDGEASEAGIRICEEATEVAQKAGNKIALAEALASRGSEILMHGDIVGGIAMQEESLTLFHAAGDWHSVAIMMNELAYFRSWFGEYARSRALLEEALTIGRRLDCHGAIAHMLSNLGMILAYQGHYVHAGTVLEESLALRRKPGFPIPIADTLNDLATLVGMQGDFAAARILNAECLLLKRRHGFHRTIGWVLGSTGWLSLYEGDLDSAQRDYTECLALFQADQANPRGLARAYWGLGRIALHHGDLPEARTLLHRSLSMRCNLIAVREICESLEAFALLLTAEANVDQAARLLGATEALRTKLGMPYSPAERPTFARCLSDVRSLLGTTECNRRLTEGRTLTLGQAAELALK